MIGVAGCDGGRVSSNRVGVSKPNWLGLPVSELLTCHSLPALQGATDGKLVYSWMNERKNSINTQHAHLVPGVSLTGGTSQTRLSSAPGAGPGARGQRCPRVATVAVTESGTATLREGQSGAQRGGCPGLQPSGAPETGRLSQARGRKNLPNRRAGRAGLCSRQKEQPRGKLKGPTVRAPGLQGLRAQAAEGGESRAAECGLDSRGGGKPLRGRDMAGLVFGKKASARKGQD